MTHYFVFLYVNQMLNPIQKTILPFFNNCVYMWQVNYIDEVFMYNSKYLTKVEYTVKKH